MGLCSFEVTTMRSTGASSHSRITTATSTISSGTSAATPIVSGVAALMRQANPNLTWRDLKLILAASARKNDPTNIWVD